MINKVLGVLVGLFLIVIGFLYNSYTNLNLKYLSLVNESAVKIEELKTTQEALKKENHKLVTKPNTTFKETVKYTPKEIDMSEQERESFKSVIEYMNENMVMKENVKPADTIKNDEIVASNEDEGLSDMERQSYKSVIAYLYQQLGVTERTTEIEYSGGSESIPVMPVIHPTTNADKRWTALAEYKLNDGLNLGIAKKVWRELSLGGSVNQSSDIGILGMYRW